MTAEFHDLEFGLSLVGKDKSSDGEEDDYPGKPRSATTVSSSTFNLVQRSNIVIADGDGSKGLHWKTVPGDLADKWKPYFLIGREHRLRHVRWKRGTSTSNVRSAIEPLPRSTEKDGRKNTQVLAR